MGKLGKVRERSDYRQAEDRATDEILTIVNEGEVRADCDEALRPQVPEHALETAAPPAPRRCEGGEVIKAHRDQYSVQMMCRVLGVAPSGYYAWLKQPLSNRTREDARLLRLIRASFVASQGIYGAPRVFLDLREAGETCSKHRVARLMRENNLCAFMAIERGAGRSANRPS